MNSRRVVFSLHNVVAEDPQRITLSRIGPASARPQVRPRLTSPFVSSGLLFRPHSAILTPLSPSVVGCFFVNSSADPDFLVSRLRGTP